MVWERFGRSAPVKLISNIEHILALPQDVFLCLANYNFASHRACHNATSHRCMLFISRAVLTLAKHT